MRRTFSAQVRIPAPVEAVFRWHERPEAFSDLVPPGQPVRVAERSGTGLHDAVLRLRLGPEPFALTWIAEHRDFIPNRQFRDVQTRGPFAWWSHTHRFEPDGPGGCILEDSVEYELPFGPLGDLFAPLVARQLRRVFEHRHKVTLAAFSLQ